MEDIMRRVTEGFAATKSTPPEPTDANMSAAEALVIVLSTAERFGLLTGAVLLPGVETLTDAINSEYTRAPAAERSSDSEGSSSEDETAATPLSVDALTASLPALELRCTNADPNYGVVWFQCRGHPSESSRRVLRRAKVAMAHELQALGPIYLQALCRCMLVQAVLSAVLEAHPDRDILTQVSKGRNTNTAAIAAAAAASNI